MSAREKALIIIALILAGGLAVVILFGSPPSGPAPIIDLHPPATAPAPAPVPAPILGPIEAGTLAVAFRRNEVRAEADYTGHRYLVRGYVKRVSTDIEGNGHLELMSLGVGEYPDDSIGWRDGIDCVFDPDLRWQLMPLEAGDRVAIVGEVGQMLIGTVFARHCELREMPRRPSAAQPAAAPQTREPEPALPPVEPTRPSQ